MSEKKDGKEQDKNYISVNSHGDKQIHMDLLLKTLFLQYMGSTLDLARISGMSDRSFEQFEKTIKDECYKIINYGTQILKDSGNLK